MNDFKEWLKENKAPMQSWDFDNLEDEYWGLCQRQRRYSLGLCLL